MDPYTCDICSRVFPRKHSLTRHKARKIPCKPKVVNSGNMVYHYNTTTETVTTTYKTVDRDIIITLNVYDFKDLYPMTEKTQAVIAEMANKVLADLDEYILRTNEDPINVIYCDSFTHERCPLVIYTIEITSIKVTVHDGPPSEDKVL